MSTSVIGIFPINPYLDIGSNLYGSIITADAKQTAVHVTCAKDYNSATSACPVDLSLTHMDQGSTGNMQLTRTIPDLGTFIYSCDMTDKSTRTFCARTIIDPVNLGMTVHTTLIISETETSVLGQIPLTITAGLQNIASGVTISPGPTQTSAQGSATGSQKTPGTTAKPTLSSSSTAKTNTTAITATSAGDRTASWRWKVAFGAVLLVAQLVVL